jgi:hypothetical protein
MKKAILLLVFVSALISPGIFAQAPQIEIRDLSENIVNGTTILVDTSNINIDIMPIELMVKNATDQELSLFVRRIMNSKVPDSDNGYCFGILCYISDTSSYPMLLAPGVDTSFLADYYPYAHAGLTSITYEFFEGGGHSTIREQVTVNFLVSPVGLGNDLNSYEFTGAFPNPASSSTSFNFSIPAISNGNIVIRNLLGSVVRDVKLDKQQGRIAINTNDLKDGVYFYSFILDNKAIMTKKLVIRH